MSDPTSFRWDDLQLFLAAYRTRSLTQAAAGLGLNQSTLSRRLTGFEDALGAALFDRTPEGLRPTPLADRLLEPAERAETASHDVARSAASAEVRVEGNVKLALTDGLAYYLAAPALPRLLEDHPALRVSFVVNTESADLSRREADLALRFYRPTQGDLVAKRVWEGGYRVFAAPALAIRLGRGPHRLEGLPFVAWSADQTHYPECQWEMERRVEPVVRASTMTTRVALAQAGAGCIQLAGGQRLPGLVELDTEPTDLTAEIWLVTHRNLRETARVRAVWEWVESLVEERLNVGPEPLDGAAE